jgi:peptidoglycan/LPS O-acetylase OafA/YrhL
LDTRETHLPIGALIAAIGAILLIVSLFLDWYDGLTGFTVFEFLDLLLTGLALGALFELAAAMGAVRTPMRPGVLLGIGMLALIIVLSQVVNDPPAVAGPNGEDQATGIWLALGGAALMVAGAVLSTARIAISVEPRDGGRAAPTVARTDEAPTVADEPPARRS